MTENGNGSLVMPVSPMYGGNSGFGNSFGGDWAWILLLLLLCGGGWGGNFGGFGGGMYEFPWLLNGQQGINANTNNGFQNALLNDNITSVRDSISNLSTQLCNTGSDIQMALANGFSGVEQGANSRQMANMQQSYANQTAMLQGFNGIQSQLANCCCEQRLSMANLGADIAREACADRQAVNDGVRDILANQTAGIQRILDKMCDQELQAERRENDNLRTQLNMANLAASQTRQTTDIQNSIISELRSCPIPSQPVYGNQPIFSCPNNNSGCGCNGNFYN